MNDPLRIEMPKFTAETNQRLNYAVASICLVSLLTAITGTLWVAMPDCTVVRGLDLFLYAAAIVALLSFGVLAILFLFVAALPGWYFGKRAIIVEMILIAGAIMVLTIYGSLPHPGAGFSYHCLGTNSAF